MRTILIAILAILVSIISIPLYLIELIIRCFSPMTAARFAQFIVVIVFNSVLFISGAKKQLSDGKMFLQILPFYMLQITAAFMTFYWHMPLFRLRPLLFPKRKSKSFHVLLNGCIF